MSEEQVVGSPEREIHVQALVTLEKLDVSKQEEDEDELFKMRAKLYRFFTEKDETGWKERGIGEMKIMKHKTSKTCRVVMRRDKTFKLCANHAISGNMEITQHMGNEKALVWSTPSDYADDEPKQETLCVRFGKPESAADFKNIFEECVAACNSGKDGSDKLADDLSTLKVTDEKDSKKEDEKDCTEVNGEKDSEKDKNTEKTEESVEKPED